MSQEQRSRPSWDEYFIKLTQAVAERGTCNRGQCGSVVVKDKRVLTTGYVGSPPGLAHCDDVGHLMGRYLDEDGNESQHCIRTIHAEQNAICQAARFGVSLVDATLYTKMEPCVVCARLIISAGIVKVVSEKQYHRAELTREMFKDAGIEQVVLDNEVKEYTNQ